MGCNLRRFFYNLTRTRKLTATSCQSISSTTTQNYIYIYILYKQIYKVLSVHVRWVTQYVDSSTHTLGFVNKFFIDILYISFPLYIYIYIYIDIFRSCPYMPTFVKDNFTPAPWLIHYDGKSILSIFKDFIKRIKNP